MVEQPVDLLPVPGRKVKFSEVSPWMSPLEPSGGKSAAKEESLLQRLLRESTTDELTLQLKEPVRVSRTDIVEMISRGATVLSSMAAELGVVFRVRIHGKKISAMVDEDKIRRVVNALAIHLLSVSQSESRVTIEMEEKPNRARHGLSLRLSSGSVVLPWKTDPEFPAELDAQADLVVCRQIIEKQNGELSAAWQDDHKLSYSIWIPT